MIENQEYKIFGRKRARKKKQINNIKEISKYFVKFIEFKKKKRYVLDIGSGLARQSLRYAELGARVIFADVVVTNLEFVRRVATAKGLLGRISFLHFTSLKTLSNCLAKGM